MKDVDYEETQEEMDRRRLNPKERHFLPFVVCGDLDGWDSDMSYDLPEGYVSLKPVQPPTEPAYKAALEKKKGIHASQKKKPTLTEYLQKNAKKDSDEEMVANLQESCKIEDDSFDMEE
jgi:hypothetical protein